MKKLLLKSTLAVSVLLTAVFFTGCASYQGVPQERVEVYNYSYNNPTWAPAYYQGARYYYFPDIEVYYDLATRDFIVLNMGQWMFVPSIAPFYASYDLFNSYIVIVNTRVYQPWMHHHYYVRHYPRYYYIDYYDYSNIPYVRGFNENQKGAIYWQENERHRARQWDDRNIRSNRQFTYSAEDRRVQSETTRRVNQERINATRTTTTRDNSTVNRTTTTRDAGTATSTRNQTTTRTQTTTRPTTQSSTPTNRTSTQTTRRTTDTNYYGTPIGNPVRVEPQMRRTETTTRSSTTGTRTGTSTSTPERTSTGTRSGR